MVDAIEHFFVRASSYLGYWGAAFLLAVLWMVSVAIKRSPEFMDVVRKINADKAEKEFRMLDYLEDKVKELIKDRDILTRDFRKLEKRYEQTEIDKDLYKSEADDCNLRYTKLEAKCNKLVERVEELEDEVSAT